MLKWHSLPRIALFAHVVIGQGILVCYWLFDSHLQTAPSDVNSTGAPANIDVALYSRTSIIRISRLPGLFAWSQFAHEYFSISHDQDPQRYPF